jgi:Rieske Fe-S protein
MLLCSAHAKACWDCPCHGSHFSVGGTALNAPAVESLAEANVEARGDRDSERQAAIPSVT